MSLTNILAISETVGINDHRFVGQVVSRNQRLSTSEIVTVVPFGFEIKPMNYLLYSQNRALLNSLRIPDKSLEQYLNFGATNWINYIKYQGDMNSGQIAGCQWQTSSAAKNLVLGSLPSISSAAYIVRQGDFCQVGRYAYIATQDVQRGVGSTVTIPVHRNLISTLTSPLSAVIGEFGTTVSMGGSPYVGTTFPVILREYPTYTLVPMTNDSYIQWAGSFLAFESVL
ncbi:hypothetical protein UFOVP1613_12 [uncultured Caudovirales phage]|uniref:Uncharacterized protein n=1 Tax=uncultured Caudovirales phage TaxID=2100421 RepID=A0A6J5SVA2_9CAUD|nr:hypothetical protein UFOVP1163_14 [uncultured Caudovirales phage]CAB4219255.1 hypothetical protein UFOVP1613_12 [uncultured Caudovirales phage]